MAETDTTNRVTIAGRPFVLRQREVARTLRKVDPEPIDRHFVVVAGKRFPPKQVIGAVTGLDRADFTTHQARRTLMRLGFTAGRLGPSAARTPHDRAAGPATSSPSLGDQLMPLAGRWVAIKNDEVLHAAKTPRELVSWLTRHGRRADTMFRVPEDDLAATGLAPL